MKYISAFFSLSILSLFLFSCSSESKSFQKFPADELARDLDAEKNYSIILYDMDIREDGSFWHRYKTVIPKDAGSSEAQVLANNSSSGIGLEGKANSSSDSTMSQMGETEAVSGEVIDELDNEIAQAKLSDWMPVSEEQFEAYSNDMGMEIITKKDGSVEKIPSPPGYTHYVGNEKYGQWQQNPSTGESFWSFYGKYMMMQQVFSMFTSPRYNSFNDYNRNYRGQKPYYGNANGQQTYGTGSAQSKKMNPGFEKRMQSNNNFKSRVNNMVQRSRNDPKAGERYRSARRSGSSLGSKSARTQSGSDARRKSSSSWSSGSKKTTSRPRARRGGRRR